ncbi:ribose 5-phosphate isomerase B [Candidatus Falkowbacteria bacterium]|jgi:ribose 5-phosphate isomerase B|nr:ribose 5-phosphate isomerase B [Candidatus Falkowbacteria bacterium]MBT6574568.1 ribose 5-phosphate isomerase B [Candidatus Falkowbacteria bacterium]MBT7348480.1 ribose 5-phosphate isomerase B [Candidatus Falkowbacteria bacterium]MBT7500855.1 ribose 5-phosphate isomerase B [Candidatus Falkowbacteria bacterium]
MANSTNSAEQLKDVVLVGSDHGGFELKRKILDFLELNYIPVEDVGTYFSEPCDYPDIARLVAEPISTGTHTRGILVCGTGLGISIAANKSPGVQAAVGYNEIATQMAREHNDAHIICFGERTMDHDEVLRCVKIFLETPFSNGERHIKRLQKLE